MFRNLRKYFFWKNLMKEIEKCTEPIEVRRSILGIDFVSAPPWFLQRAVCKLDQFDNDPSLDSIKLDIAYETYKRAKQDVINGLS